MPFSTYSPRKVAGIGISAIIVGGGFDMNTQQKTDTADNAVIFNGFTIIIKFICILAILAILTTLCVGVWRVCSQQPDTSAGETIDAPSFETSGNALDDNWELTTDQPITISLPPGVEIDQEMWDVFNILAGRGRVTVVLGSAMMEFDAAADLLEYPNTEVRVGD